MINNIESQLTLAAVLLDMYMGVKDRADKRLVSKNEMGAHLVNLQAIQKKFSAAITENKKHKKACPIPSEMQTELMFTEDEFSEMFECLKEYYDKIPAGFEPVFESFKENTPDDINWIAYNNHQGEA